MPLVKTRNLPELIRKIDLFGHPVNLNYQKDEPKRKTLFGGVCSLFIIMQMIAYVVGSV